MDDELEDFEVNQVIYHEKDTRYADREVKQFQFVGKTFNDYENEAIKNIAQEWYNTRKILPPQKKWLIKDIVNPILYDDLSQLVYERYSYVEE